MRSHMFRILGFTFLLLAARPAFAFQDIRIKEVFTGSVAHPNAQYVVFQAFSPGQNNVTGHGLRTYNAAGVHTGDFFFTGPVAVGTNQMTILIATAEAAALFNLTPDLLMPAVLTPLGGHICWSGTASDECFSWGSHTGPQVGGGTPYNVGAGMIPGYAARRRLDVCLTALLEGCDDTNDTANDFITVIPDPVNNAGTHGTPPPATCANGVIEGLEACDDNNTTDGDGCSAICRIEPAPLTPAALSVDVMAHGGSDANGVFEPGEMVEVEPSWTNGGGTNATVVGQFTNFRDAVNSQFIFNGGADYGTIPPAGTASCEDGEDCYFLAVPFQARPSLHWDTTVDEILNAEGAKTWTIHIGDSFTDVPRAYLFYPFIENLFHHGITGGCGPDTYCPTGTTLRRQMAVFLLKALLGAAYTPPPATGIFDDVPADAFQPWIEDLYIRGITGGCAGGPPPAPISYCPDAQVQRKQMAVFLLKTDLGAGYTPPAATGIFDDVPADAFQPWIEDLYNRQITGGCAGGPPPAPISYCPENPVTRGQMATFLVKTFSLLLYGP